MSDDTRLRPGATREPDDHAELEARQQEEGHEEHAAPLPLDGSSAQSTAATGGATAKQASLWGDAWGELRRKPVFVLSALLVAVAALMAFFPSLFTDTDPRACDLANSLGRPQPGHPFGYDLQGCDYYAQTIYGARASISVGFLTMGVATAVAVTGGALAGYYGGAFDAITARIADIVFGVPTILGGIVILSTLEEQGIWQVSLVLIVLGWPTMLRLMRSQVLSVKEADYVQAARALGAGDLRILRRHILPNAIAPVVVYATIFVGVIIGAEATLSFLGVGLQLPAISWGLMLSDAQNRVLTAPHLLLFPGLFLSVTILSFILMGDALRDALDPRLR